ncbi:MAG: hypothetical protein JXQ75_23950 [Phycisphaerae bacterium]|nr:hypothetical protein [Phycisphaerae bacterium]
MMQFAKGRFKTESLGYRPGRQASGLRPFEYIAFWQFLIFIMLLCLVWVNEVLDLPNLIYGAPPAPSMNWLGASILTVCVIVVGFISIAYSYQQQKRVLAGMIKICSYCNRVQLDEEAWQRLDLFVSDKTRAEFSHGVCPECFAKVVQQDRARQGGTTASRIL